jgi:hypothetical protein
MPAASAIGLHRPLSADEVVQRDLKRLRHAAATVVGTVFFGTLLKTMRESRLRGPFGHGGRGEEIFSAQLHGLLAERAGTSFKGGLGDAVYRSLEAQQQRISRGRGRMWEA